ncbi:GFA family protein [Sandarakinorhabdus sp. DWP1-3-1]|uniref:GFA family protein n=1 Tax=Sandarakinorhabdus sp. DWP1-3-1 TaxID=2804627 RepID=UPI003CF7E67E
MLELSCHCGDIRIRIAKRPDYIHDCNCTLCSKTGVRWGYFHPSEVEVTGISGTYNRVDKAEPAAAIGFCPRCSATTHWTLTDTAVARFGNGMMGVNMWLANPGDLAGIELRFPDGRSWEGEGDFGYVRDSYVIGTT